MILLIRHSSYVIAHTDPAYKIHNNRYGIYEEITITASSWYSKIINKLN